MEENIVSFVVTKDEAGLLTLTVDLPDKLILEMDWRLGLAKTIIKAALGLLRVPVDEINFK